MISTVLLGFVLLGAAGAGSGPETLSPIERSAYEAAKSKAGNNALAHVKLAIWCEARGLLSERAEHLEKALSIDPSNALAHGLLGQLAYRGEWGTPDVVERKIQNDPVQRRPVQEYVTRRAKTLDTADAQLQLAIWCDKNGLKDQAIAHYQEVLRLDSGKDAVWRRLGYKKQGEQWIKPDEAAADRQDADRQRRADKQWRSRLERIRDGLDSKDRSRRGKAEQSVGDVKDPRAVPMIWSVLLRGSEKSQLAAVKMLAEIDGRTASNALAALAVYSPSALVRARATEELSERDLRDFVGKLIGLVQKPYEYEVKPLNGPGSTGRLVLKRDKSETEFSYQFPGVDPSMLPRYFTSSVPFDPFSVQNLLMASVANGTGTLTLPGQGGGGVGRTGPGALAGFGGLQGAANNPANNLVYGTYAMAALQDLQLGMAVERNVQMTNQYLQQKLAQDIQLVERTNAAINQLDDRVLPILKKVTGQDFGVEPDKWKKWWATELGYLKESDSKDDKVTSEQARQQLISHTSFGSGTLVQTVEGRRPIEAIALGDRVLSQDTTTGEISFQPVIAVYHRKATALLRIAVDGDSLAATGIQRFWRQGEGWIMARDLAPNQRIRTDSGPVAFRSVAPESGQDLFSLDVAQNHDFFVGAKSLLVHDASLVQTVFAPFDRPPDLAAPAPGAKAPGQSARSGTAKE